LRFLAAGRLRRQRLLVGFLQFLVLPLDDRLRAQAREELAHLGLGPGRGNLVGNQVADRVEWLQGGRLHRFELENLIALLHAYRSRDVARLHRVHQLLELRRHVAAGERTNQAAIRLGRRVGRLRRQLGEVFTLQRAGPQIRDLLLRLVVFGHVDAGLGRWHLDEDLAQHDRGGLGELLRVAGIVLTRLFFCDVQFGADLLSLNLLDEHLALQRLAQVVHRHVFLRQRGLELRVVLEFLFLPDVGDDRLELIVAKAKAQLAPALQEEQLVDRIHNQLRGDLGELLFQRLVVFQRRGVDLLPLHLLAQHGDLPLLELGFRDDVAVHLDEDLLEDVPPRRRSGGV
jgi:hypothetical protein